MLDLENKTVKGARRTRALLMLRATVISAYHPIRHQVLQKRFNQYIQIRLLEFEQMFFFLELPGSYAVRLEYIVILIQKLA